MATNYHNTMFVPVQRTFKSHDDFDSWAIQAVGRDGYVGDDEGIFCYYSLASALEAADEFRDIVLRQSASAVTVRAHA